MKYYLSKQNDDPRLLELNTTGYPIKTILLSILNMKSKEFANPEFTGDQNLLDPSNVDIPLDTKYLASDVCDWIRASGDEKAQVDYIRSVLTECAPAYFDLFSSKQETSVEAPTIQTAEKAPAHETVTDTVRIASIDDTESGFDIPYSLKLDLGMFEEIDDENFFLPGITDEPTYTVPYAVTLYGDEISHVFIAYHMLSDKSTKERNDKYSNYTVSSIIKDFEAENTVELPEEYASIPNNSSVITKHDAEVVEEAIGESIVSSGEEESTAEDDQEAVITEEIESATKETPPENITSDGAESGDFEEEATEEETYEDNEIAPEDDDMNDDDFPEDELGDEIPEEEMEEVEEKEVTGEDTDDAEQKSEETEQEEDSSYVDIEETISAEGQRTVDIFGAMYNKHVKTA